MLRDRGGSAGRGCRVRTRFRRRLDDGDGGVGSSDLFLLLVNWGSATPCPGDRDGSGDVTAADMLVLLSSWGACP